MSWCIILLLFYSACTVVISMTKQSTLEKPISAILSLKWKKKKNSWKWRTYTVSMKNRHDRLAIATHFTNVTTTYPWLLNSWCKVVMAHITEVGTPPCWSTWDLFQWVHLTCCEWLIQPVTVSGGVTSGRGKSPDCTTAAAAAKSLQLCPTLCDPIDGSPPGSPSLGFSRQQDWSGLPFPSPMHESEKWKWSRSVVSDS